MKEQKKDEMISVPYIVYESSQASSERVIKRLVVVVIILIIALILTNGAWIYYESLFDTIAYEQDGNGVNNINAGEQGGIINGTENESETEKIP